MGILGKDEQQAFFKMIYLVIADKKMEDNLQPFLTHTLKQKARDSQAFCLMLFTQLVLQILEEIFSVCL